MWCTELINIPVLCSSVNRLHGTDKTSNILTVLTYYCWKGIPIVSNLFTILCIMILVDASSRPTNCSKFAQGNCSTFPMFVLRCENKNELHIMKIILFVVYTNIDKTGMLNFQFYFITYNSLKLWFLYLRNILRHFVVKF